MSIAGAMSDVPLASLTTLGVGGRARWFLATDDLDDLAVALHQAEQAGMPTLILGGGSNVVFDDAGFDGLVLQLTTTRLSVKTDETSDEAIVHADAGLAWDALVAATVERGFAGLEALSGIPGHVGAAPIQNIGAYGRELADVLVSVTVYDRKAGCVLRLTPDACDFGYRTSRFKKAGPDAYVILSISVRVQRDTQPIALRYADLKAYFGANTAPSAASLRAAVLSVRGSKSMVYDPADVDSHSVGSFFMNPVVDEATADRVVQYALDHGLGVCPRYPAGPDASKLSAAWLIERAGFERGYALGSAALSSKHVLAIINPGAATAADVRGLARRIQQGVTYFWDVALTPEARVLDARGTLKAL